MAQKKFAALAFLVIRCVVANAQSTLTLEQAIAFALKNNPEAKAASLEVEHQQWMKRASVDVPKTNVTLTYGQYNSIIKNDNNITLSQTIPFPTVWARELSLGKAMIKSSEYQKVSIDNEITYQVSSVFYQLLYLKAKSALLTRQDSLLERLSKAANARYAAGEVNLLIKTSAEVQWNEAKNQLRQNNADILIQRSQLGILTQSSITDVTGNIEEFADTIFTSSPTQNPALKYFAQQVNIAEAQKKAVVAKILPDITIGYFNQTLIGYQTINAQEQYFGSSSRFQGFQAGVAIPLWFPYHHARAKAATTNRLIAEQNFQLYEQRLNGQLEQARLEHEKVASSVDYYRSFALPNADSLIKQAEAAFRNGEIDYTSYLINLQSTATIRNGYLDALLLLHQRAIRINYLTGNSQPSN